MKIGDDISMNLTLTTSDFVYQVKKSNELLKELRKALQDTAEAAKRTDSHFNGVAGSFRHFMQMAATARFAMLDFHDVFLRLPLAVIKTSGEIERMTKLMEGLSTATDKVADANKSKDFVFTLAQNAPFDVKALTDSFVKLKSGGIDPMNGSMQALVDSVAKFGGTSEQLHRASIAIQQMSGKGVISMEELRQQLGEAVPDAMQMMAMGVGKSMQELVKAISNGEVESKSALERMFAVMSIKNYGAAQEMMQTWTGMFEQLKTKWELFKYAVGGGNGGQGVFSEARKEVQLLLDSFEGSAARDFGADLSEMMYELAHGVRGLTEGIIKFYEEIKTVGEIALFAFLGGKLYSIMAGAKAEFAQLSLTYRKNAQEYILAQQEKAAVALKALEDEKMKTQMSVFMMEDELAAKKSQVIALAREQQIATNAYVAHNNVVKTAMIDKFIVEQATVNASRELAAASLATANAYGVEGRAMQSQIAVMEANIAAMRASIATKEQMIVASNAAGASITNTGKIMSGMGGVFNALGGWLTVLTAAIMAAVWAWDEFGNAAEKNAERGRRAANGLSDKKDLDSINSEIKNREQFLTDNAKLGDNARLNGSELERRKKELETLYQERKMIEDNILKREIEDGARRAKRKSEIKIADETKEMRAEKDAIARYAANEENRIKNDSSLSEKARQDALKKNKDWETLATKDVGKRLFSKESNIHAVAMTQLTKDIEAASGDEKVKLQAIYDSHKEALDSAEKRLLGVDKVGTSYVSMKGTKADKGGSAKNQTGSLNREITDAKEEIDKYLEKQAMLGQDIDFAEKTKRDIDAKYKKLIDDKRLTVTENGPKGKTIAAEFNPNNSDHQAKLKQAKDLELQERMLAEATKLAESEIKSLAKEQAEYNEATQVTGFRSEFASQKIRMLNAEFEKQRAGLKGAKLAQAEEAHHQRLFVAAQQDALAYLKGAKEESLRAEIDMTTNAQQKVIMQYQLTSLKLEAEYEQRAAEMLAAIDKQNLSEIEKEEKKQQELARIRQAYDLRRATAEKQMQQQSKSGFEKMAQDWGDMQKQMDSATSKWAGDFMTEIDKLVTTGKADFKSLAVSILKDTSSMFLKKGIAGLLGMDNGPSSNWGIFGKLIPGLGGGGGAFGNLLAANKYGTNVGSQQTNMLAQQDAAFNTPGVGGAVGGAAGGATGGMSEWFDSMKTKFSEMFDGLGEKLKGVGEMITNTFGGSVEGVSQSLEQMSQGPIASTTEALGESVTASMAEIAATEAQTVANTAVTASEYAEEIANEVSAASEYFANGGIMTSSGRMPLNFYAKGGIADSPQVAVFGEGAMNEAYVPLPDGRSIPVTMTTPEGMGGTNVAQQVNINIVVNQGEGGGEKKSSAGEDQGAWKKMADRVKSVVKEELVNQQRPGGVLYK